MSNKINHWASTANGKISLHASDWDGLHMRTLVTPEDAVAFAADILRAVNSLHRVAEAADLGIAA